jgi:hypothetical protein
VESHQGPVCSRRTAGTDGRRTNGPEPLGERCPGVFWVLNEGLWCRTAVDTKLVPQATSPGGWLEPTGLQKASPREDNDPAAS